MAIKVSDVCKWLAARVEELDATAYAQPGYASSWHEPTGLLVDEEGHPAGHLAFTVDPTYAEATDRDQAQWGLEVQLLQRVTITFAYHLRPGAQRDDQRLAMDAGEDVLRAVLQEWNAAVVDPVSTWDPSFHEDGDWLLNRVAITVRHEIPLSME